MIDASAPAWRPTGLVWTEAGARLEWLSPTGDVRASAVEPGARLSLRVGSDRRCTGLRWDGRRVPCTAAAPIDAGAKSGQCVSCAAIARTRSVATDTALDDPREFTVYLAHHGSIIKTGITATERGQARLLEQGALSSMVLSAGSLLSARRCEALLTTALGIPQQVRTARKRGARLAPGTALTRAAELVAVAEHAAGLDWPSGQTRTTTDPVDHTPTYGLPHGGIAPDQQIDPLHAEATINGEVVCRIGRDLYLATSAGLMLLDTGLLQGWALSRAHDDEPFTAGATLVTKPRATTETQHDVLF
ncbi:DUF2797 domain-containing protein [Promicromonospora iranensis]|uniref:DUF2797 domain-containing protein n=1 Tax=Promicromonospora iranensis TaxID=1105144 RepID=A0ABU2CVF3_9MICO|nr:DUF2797 domain-containing protein [Promicromonospora iranensis]MDR7385329.1 hypothetical protein [Promicromonospora iranensis]